MDLNCCSSGSLGTPKAYRCCSQNLKAKAKCKPTKDSILITRYATSIIQVLPSGPWDLKKVFPFTFMLLNKLTIRSIQQLHSAKSEML